MVLDPLTEVRIRMFMPVVVGSGQLMMDILRHGKRSQSDENANNPQRQSRTEQDKEALLRLTRQYCHKYLLRTGVQRWCDSEIQRPENMLIRRTLSTGMDFLPVIR